MVLFCVGKVGSWKVPNTVMGFCCVVLGACCRLSREQSDSDGCRACRVCCEQSDGNDVLVLLALVD